MNLHHEKQGTSEWLALRERYFTASEAPAMLGLSAYMTRSELLKQKATGITQDYDPATLARFNRGHETEDQFRPIAEDIIGDELFPVVGSIEIDGLKLLASFDGINLMETVIFEHKLFNERLVECLIHGDLPDTHWPQVEHQLLVSGAGKCLFVTSDGTADKFEALEYTSKPERRARVIEGWKRFADDLDSYTPQPAPRVVVAAPVDSLPYLVIQTEGRVISSNLAEFRAAASQMIARVKTDLQTDQDFADAEAMTRALKDGETRLQQAKDSALAQTATIEELFRAVDDIAAQMRAKRLELEKLVKAEKDNRRRELVLYFAGQLTEYEQELNRSAAHGYLSLTHSSAFADCIKGKSKLESMQNALHARLLELKADASQHALRIKAMIDAINAADASHLFPDMERLTITPLSDEAMQALITQRKQADAERIERAAQAMAERQQADAARIRQQEEANARAKIEAEQQAEAERIALEQQRQAEEKAAAAQAEARAEDAPTQIGATLNLGDICQRLGFSVTADFLQSLGFAAQSERSARRYAESDFPAICTAIAAHVQAVAAHYRTASV